MSLLSVLKKDCASCPNAGLSKSPTNSIKAPSAVASIPSPGTGQVACGSPEQIQHMDDDRDDIPHQCLNGEPHNFPSGLQSRQLCDELNNAPILKPGDRKPPQNSQQDNGPYLTSNRNPGHYFSNPISNSGHYFSNPISNTEAVVVSNNAFITENSEGKGNRLSHSSDLI